MKYGNIRNIERKILSDNWYTLNKYSYEYQKEDGAWELQHREAYDRGNGAAVLLYNPEKETVVLIRQFRMPTYVNGNPDGMLVEVPAGLLEDDAPEERIKIEIEEETGYRVHDVQKVFEAYMSPGSVTEILHFFIARYNDEMKVAKGGGAEGETEHVEVLEMPFSEAIALMSQGKIRDAKTMMLLQYAQVHKLLRPNDQ